MEWQQADRQAGRLSGGRGEGGEQVIGGYCVQRCDASALVPAMNDKLCPTRDQTPSLGVEGSDIQHILKTRQARFKFNFSYFLFSFFF